MSQTFKNTFAPLPGMKKKPDVLPCTKTEDGAHVLTEFTGPYCIMCGSKVKNTP